MRKKPQSALAVGKAGAVQQPRAKAPRTHRELAQAIFAERDPVTVGRELLESGSERGSTVKARVWETLVEFLLGKPEARGGSSSGTSGRVNVVWDLPAPPHEPEEEQVQNTKRLGDK